MKTLVKNSIIILLTLLVISICIIVYLSIGIQTVYAHPGRLDENGGHYDHSDGSYHYHNGEGSNSGEGSGNDTPDTDTPDKEVKNDDTFPKSFQLYYGIAYTVFLLLSIIIMKIKWKNNRIESFLSYGIAIITLLFLIFACIDGYSVFTFFSIPIIVWVIYCGIDALFLSKRKKPSIPDDIDLNKPNDLDND